MIDLEQVRKVAHLARLELLPAEEEQLTGQLNDILDYFGQLNELDTEAVEPTTRAIEVSNINPGRSAAAVCRARGLAQSRPEREDSFFKVPKILADAD
ncbi:MAG: Asp-tRNA(Asn)/Glu-tRNA(Gln) amidotransferase subunit GatC [Leptolyngbyaceae cyanobacterium SM1_1_3]|nr:Asp-tRNA(Asn)/Glu-tRNA(Gln) amidotransferase subunit GatC [Leptolyngbyaceae cyanobacterium SM1_1_3]